MRNIHAHPFIRLCPCRRLPAQALAQGRSSLTRVSSSRGPADSRLPHPSVPGHPPPNDSPNAGQMLLFVGAHALSFVFPVICFGPDGRSVMLPACLVYTLCAVLECVVAGYPRLASLVPRFMLLSPGLRKGSSELTVEYSNCQSTSRSGPSPRIARRRQHSAVAGSAVAGSSSRSSPRQRSRACWSLGPSWRRGR